MKRYPLKDLIKFEEKNQVWEMTFFQYPVWLYFREDMSSQCVSIKKTFYRPKMKVLLKSMYQTIQFLLTQRKYKKVYFLADRQELVEAYRNDNEEGKILFLFDESLNRTIDDKYIDAVFLNVVRYFLRKTTYLIFPFKYKELIGKLSLMDYDDSKYNKMKVAMGDAVFLRFLAYILDNRSTHLYAGAVVPQGEKFLNLLNSCEIQHGVIHPEHVGYIGIPEVKNTLILYDTKYKNLLQDSAYSGKLVVDTFKENFLTAQTDRNFLSVIYTQPIEKMQKSIEEFFKTVKPKNLWIQKHPRDTYEYDLDEAYFVHNTRPTEVQFPICYTSTIIENFTKLGIACFIYDIKEENINIENIISMYIKDDKTKFMKYDSLYEIYEKLLKSGDSRVH